MLCVNSCISHHFMHQLHACVQSTETHSVRYVHEFSEYASIARWHAGYTLDFYFRFRFSNRMKSLKGRPIEIHGKRLMH